MRFEFMLADQPTDRLQELEDVLRPLLVGLRAAGHSVGVTPHGRQPPPAINIAVEGFTTPDLAASVAEARGRWPATFRFGTLCPTAPDALPPPRRDALRALLPASDFAWVVEGVGLTPDLVEAHRIASLTYGFDETLVGPRLIADPALRDLDVAIYGPEGARIEGVAARVEMAGLTQFCVRFGALPDYLTTDLLSRAKVAIVIGERSLPSGLVPRILKAVYNQVAVVTEPGAIEAGRLGAGVAFARDVDMPARCRAIIAGGDFVGLGATTLELLRAGPSMADAMTAVVQRLPPGA